MEQDDLIQSIESPEISNEQTQQMPTSQQYSEQIQQDYAPSSLPEDLKPIKKKVDPLKIVNLVAYSMLGFAAIFLLFLFILGFLK